jgi:hypothetical protein
MVGRRRVRLFDPRLDGWPEHFVLIGRALFVVGVTGPGRATKTTLGFHDPTLGGPLIARHGAVLDGSYPPLWARTWQDRFD